MTSGTIIAPPEREHLGHDGFGQLLSSEWTKFRTVRGWIVALLAAMSAIVGLGLFPGVQGSCGRVDTVSACGVPVGPDGGEVTDSFVFEHQSLTGDGSITARVTSLTGLLPAPPPDGTSGQGPTRVAQGSLGSTRPGLAPWAKAGLIIKASTRPGSTYAAVMVTGSHGVRMQYDYLHDRAGRLGAGSSASPRWLRLTRTADTITGEESADGVHWATVGTAHLAGLPATAQAGLFATSPQYAQSVHEGLNAGAEGGPTQATAAFDHVDRLGTWPSPAWISDKLGGPDNPTPLQLGGSHQVDGGFTVTGSGDIAPAVAGAAGIGVTITQTLVGTFIGLIIMLVVGTMFITTEYRRGLILTTLAASPRRGRVLAAKAVVIGAVTFLTGLVAAAVVVTLGQRILRGKGVYVHPASTLTQVRVIVGTAALLAVAAVLALALGAVLRRSATAVTTVIVVIVLPYLLVLTALPPGPAAWLLRITPAAAFAVQQSTVEYPQVSNVYTPVNGYFPLEPWAGFAVLCAWAALALGVAVVLLRRRDA